MIRKTIIAFIFLFIFSILGVTLTLGKVPIISAADCSDPSYAKTNESFCRSELKNTEAQLAALLKQLASQNKQSGNYASEVKKLTTQIDALKAKIKARGLVIAQLKNDITKKVSTINTLSEKIEIEYQSLAQLLRNTNEFDNANIMHLILSDENISDFYSDLESYNSIKQAIKTSVDEINGVKTETEGQKKDLEAKQSAEMDAKYELESAQKKVAQTEAEQKKLLASSKDKEVAYQKLAAEKKAKADKIRSALFSMAGTSQKIDFGTALSYANEAKTKFGIDPAFLLAIITQESNLGANVGQCYLTNQATGAGVGKNTGTPFKNVMKPMGLAGRKGDITDFLSITSSVGRQWDKTPVSCPIPSVGGYGGAMGPAQFIPSTWGGYISRLKAVLGHSPDPWAPRDAFFASAMMLTDKGAIGSSAAAQSKAACSYYGTVGASCYYSKSVMTLRMSIQANIDLLSD